MNSITLKVPVSVAKYDDWSDDELLCLSFMLWCTKREGVFTQYYIYTSDIFHLLGQINRKNSHNILLKRIRRIFKVGRINDFTSRFEYNLELLNDQADNNRVNMHEVTITDPNTINRWSYLVGRCTDPTLIEDYKSSYKGIGTSPQTYFWKQLRMQWIH
jgi:hypothetical protein